MTPNSRVRQSSVDRLRGRNLYLCTPDRPDLEEFLEACLEGGVDIVQLREKSLEARALGERALVAGEVCRRHGVPFLLNDRPDIALGVGADGVHVGQDDVSADIARAILGPQAIVGLSTHRPSEALAAKCEPVDYLSAGPVVPTPTKPGRPGTGLDYPAEVGRIVARWRHPVPVFVTGGVSPQTVGDLVTRGARCFVVVRHLTQASDPQDAASKLRRAIDAALLGSPT